MLLLLALSPFSLPDLIKSISGIGRRTGELLSSVGIESLAQLRNASIEELVGAGITK
jgi:hypothetical protein